MLIACGGLGRNGCWCLVPKGTCRQTCEAPGRTLLFMVSGTSGMQSGNCLPLVRSRLNRRASFFLHLLFAHTAHVKPGYSAENPKRISFRLLVFLVVTFWKDNNGMLMVECIPRGINASWFLTFSCCFLSDKDNNVLSLVNAVKTVYFWHIFLSVHSRDVKPDNILLDERGKGVKLLLLHLF